MNKLPYLMIKKPGNRLQHEVFQVTLVSSCIMDYLLYSNFILNTIKKASTLAGFLLGMSYHDVFIFADYFDFFHIVFLKQYICDTILNLILDNTTQWSCSKTRIIAFFC